MESVQSGFAASCSKASVGFLHFVFMLEIDSVSRRPLLHGNSCF
jgi:hypothetical protein